MADSERPAYADYDAPAKFQAIQSIIAKRLREHPKAICSYSGGSDSDILIDLIERTRQIFQFLPKVDYVFFNTGLEMEATKRHVKETAEKYGVEIREVRPKTGIVNAVRKYGQPIFSKVLSVTIGTIQRKNIPLSIAYDFREAEDKQKCYEELCKKYPKSKCVIECICGCGSGGKELHFAPPKACNLSNI